MKRLTWLLLGFSLAGSGPLYGASGTEGASFLEIPVGARPAALGSAYTALASDVYAPVWNPAGLGFVRSPQAAGQHLNYLESINDEYVGAVFPVRPEHSFGFAIQYLGSGDIPSTDTSGNSLGTFSSHFAAYSVAYGQAVCDRLALGASAKWVNEKISDFSANAYAGSLGAMYRPIDRLSLSAVVDNFGSKLTFLQEGESLPLTGRLGVAWRPVQSWTLALEGDYAGTGLASAHTGVEWKPLDMLALRAGYRTDTTKQLSAEAGVTAGVGITLLGQELSYAWLPMGDLGTTQYFSLVLRFNANGDDRRNLIEYHTPARPRWAQATSERSSSEMEEVISLIQASSPEARQ